MATINHFEEMDSWKKAREIAKKIFLLTQEGAFSKDYALKDQINRASGSIMDNIAEGFEREGNREFIQYLAIAKGSAGEVRSQLYRIFDRNYISQSQLDEMLAEIKSISQLISGLIKYLKNTDMRGSKFK